VSLSEALPKMLSGDSRACKIVAEYCQKTAYTYIKYKLNEGEKYLLRLSVDREELAWDCIAGLFERNEDNEFVIFSDYFSDFEWEDIKESEVKIALRRLVFSKVNDGIFRNFGSFDPSLRKIIRNIKLAIQNHDGMEIEKQEGDKLLVVKGLDLDSNLPFIPPEFLEVRLSHHIEQSMQIPDILELVKMILERQTIYRPSVSITQLAVCIRKVYARMNEYSGTRKSTSEHSFISEELNTFIQEAIEKRKKDFIPSYVDSGKIEEDQFEIYFRAVENILKDDFVRDNPKADTYFEHFKNYKPDVTKKAYRSNYRQYLEYFTRKTKEDLTYLLKKAYRYSAGKIN
jgi:hypothetical protein